MQILIKPKSFLSLPPPHPIPENATPNGVSFPISQDPPPPSCSSSNAAYGYHICYGLKHDHIPATTFFCPCPPPAELEIKVNSQMTLIAAFAFEQKQY